MIVTSISLKQSEKARAAGRIQMTPQQLAASLGRFSRKNESIDEIYSIIQRAVSEDAGVDGVLKMVEYGHASLKDLANGIPIILHKCSMWLAWRLFQWLQVGAGQESSTRFISFADPNSIISLEGLGFPAETAQKLGDFHRSLLRVYQQTLEEADAYAQANPSVIRYPEGASQKTKDRIKANYGFDRARSFLPATCSTTIVLVLTPRIWEDIVCALLSSQQPECHEAARLILEELNLHVEKLVKHARPKVGWIKENRDDLVKALNLTHQYLYPPRPFPVYQRVYVSLVDPSELDRESIGPFRASCGSGFGVDKMISSIQDTKFQRLLGNLPPEVSAWSSFVRENRYDRFPREFRKMHARVTWPRMGFAEMRDMNRHRPLERDFIASHQGFYLAPEITRTEEVKKAMAEIHEWIEFAIADFDHPELFWYFLALGSEGAAEMAGPLHHLMYVLELRTGPGCHFKYVAHCKDAAEALFELVPGLKSLVHIGEGEPE